MFSMKILSDMILQHNLEFLIVPSKHILRVQKGYTDIQLKEDTVAKTYSILSDVVIRTLTQFYTFAFYEYDTLTKEIKLKRLLWSPDEIPH